MADELKLQRYKHIFSGKYSESLWQDIKAVKSEKAHDALYSLGCYCQELEDIVHKLERRIAQLEDV